MKKHQTFQEVYSDLLSDPELLPIVQELDHLCHKPRLSDSSTWQKVMLAYAQEMPQKPVLLHPQSSALRPWWQPLTRKAVLIPIIGALFLAITAFTLAFSPLLQSLLIHDSNSNIPLNYSIYDNINQSQKIGNTTITLEKGYADANQIILGYTISPPNPQLMFQYADIQTHSGEQISALQSVESKSDSQTTATRVSFDTYRLTEHASTLQLKVAASFGWTPTPVNGYKNSHIITFSFALPFHAGTVVTPGQQATSHKSTITLDRVLITQTATCVFLQGLDRIMPVLENLGPDGVTLQRAGDTHIYHMNSGFSPTDPISDSTFYFYQDFTQHPGAWTLTLHTTINAGATSYTWIFHFNVPA